MEDAPVLASRYDQYGRAMAPVYRGERTGSAAVREAVDAVRAVHKTAVLVNGVSYVFYRRTWYRIPSLSSCPFIDKMPMRSAMGRV